MSQPHTPLRIAQVAPLHESVPPKLYGGTERVVSYLTEELVRRGHDVTLFAAGDSVTRARLVAVSRRGLRLDPECADPLAPHVLLLERVAREAERFDVIHFHCDYLHFPVSRRMATPSLTTLHGRLDLPDLVPIYREFREMPLVSISDDQRNPLPWVNWRATVHHGLPRDVAAFQPRPDDHLAFLGRVSPEKGIESAVEIARKAGMRLRVAAKIDSADREYYESQVRPLLAQPHVEYVGEIDQAAKSDFLGSARALLFPIDWPEPFGLVMIEALACGTPVIAFRRGSVPEVIEDGVTGFVVDGMDDAVRSVARIPALNRRACRRAFEERFSVERMAGDYLKVYASLLREATHTRGSWEPALTS
jgi:glycosyltransferase involved in cell wall biosynthesis